MGSGGLFSLGIDGGAKSGISSAVASVRIDAWDAE